MNADIHIYTFTKHMLLRKPHTTNTNNPKRKGRVNMLLNDNYFSLLEC